MKQILPAQVQRRYEELVEKCRDENLTPDKHLELIALSDEREIAWVRHFESLVELARLRGTTLQALLDERPTKLDLYITS